MNPPNATECREWRERAGWKVNDSGEVRHAIDNLECRARSVIDYWIVRPWMVAKIEAFVCRETERMRDELHDILVAQDY